MAMARYTFRLPAGLKEAMEKKAEAKGYSSTGEYLRHVIREDLDNDNRLPDANLKDIDTWGKR